MEIDTDQLLPTGSRYAAPALELIQKLDARIDDIFQAVQQQPFWKCLFAPETPVSMLQRIFREVFRSIYWYQKHTTEAGFHMIGRLPGNEETLLKLLMLHKIEEAGHNAWAFRDYQLLGGSVDVAECPMDPACYAVTGVWWRMASVENPLGYLGAEYLFEYLTMRVAQALVPLFRSRELKTEGLRFIVDHATEDEKHAKLIRHLICDSVTRYPGTEAIMLRCFDYFRAVYPLPVWKEAYERAIEVCTPQ